MHACTHSLSSGPHALHSMHQQQTEEFTLQWFSHLFNGPIGNFSVLLLDLGNSFRCWWNIKRIYECVRVMHHKCSCIALLSLSFWLTVFENWLYFSQSHMNSALRLGRSTSVRVNYYMHVGAEEHLINDITLQVIRKTRRTQQFWLNLMKNRVLVFFHRIHSSLHWCIFANTIR